MIRSDLALFSRKRELGRETAILHLAAHLPSWISPQWRSFSSRANFVLPMLRMLGECTLLCASAAPCVAGPALSTVSEYGLDRGDSPRFENDSNLRAQIHCENIAKTRFARQFAVFDYSETFRVTILITMVIILISTSFSCSHSCTHYGRRCSPARGHRHTC